MRKTAVIAALLSFLVCLLAGYYAALWRGEQHPAETEAHAVLEEKKRIHAGTKIVYQYFYTQDRVMKKHRAGTGIFAGLGSGTAKEHLHRLAGGLFLIGAGDSAVQHRGDE